MRRRDFGALLAGGALALTGVATSAALPGGRAAAAEAKGKAAAKPAGAPAPKVEEAESPPASGPEVGPVTHLPIPRYVSLKGNEGYARRGPSLTQRIDWVFKRDGMPLRVTGEFDHWRRVEDKDGLGGWIHYTLISGIRTVIVTQPMVELHSLPEDRSTVAAKAEANVVARLLACRKDWCRISAGGESGWVKKTEVWGVDPDEVFN